MISADSLSVHYDPDVWGPLDPREFHPSRFAPEIKRSPIAFMAFGLGPRNCIGMKFAILEIKIALVKIIMNFEILPAIKNAMPQDLEFTEGFITRKPKNGVFVCFKKRTI